MRYRKIIERLQQEPWLLGAYILRMIWQLPWVIVYSHTPLRSAVELLLDLALLVCIWQFKIWSYQIAGVLSVLSLMAIPIYLLGNISPTPYVWAKLVFDFALGVALLLQAKKLSVKLATPHVEDL